MEKNRASREHCKEEGERDNEKHTHTHTQKKTNHLAQVWVRPEPMAETSAECIAAS